MEYLSSKVLVYSAQKSCTIQSPPLILATQNRGLLYLERHSGTTQSLSHSTIPLGIRDLDLLEVDRVPVAEFDVVKEELGLAEVLFMMAESGKVFQDDIHELFLEFVWDK